MDSPSQKWRDPGGKLRELGPESLSDVDLPAILISSGIKGKPAEKIAHEILAKFGELCCDKMNKWIQIGRPKKIRSIGNFERS